MTELEEDVELALARVMKLLNPILTTYGDALLKESVLLTCKAELAKIWSAGHNRGGEQVFRMWKANKFLDIS